MNIIACQFCGEGIGSVMNSGSSAVLYGTGIGGWWPFKAMAFKSEVSVLVIKVRTPPIVHCNQGFVSENALGSVKSVSLTGCVSVFRNVVA